MEEFAALDHSSSMHGIGRKTRDLFPLPSIQQSVPASRHVSRKARRRALTIHHQEEEANNTIQALNLMYGCNSSYRPLISLDENLVGIAAAQYDSLEFIQKKVIDMGKPPDDLNGPGALSMLRAANGYGDDQPVGSLASFNIEAVSMPEAGWVPVDLATLWGSDGQRKVDDFVSHQVLPPEKAKIKLEACGVRAPYSDPLLRQGRVYHQFLHKLHESHLIDYSLSPGIEKIAFFCVTKKSGKLRLIVDARRSNAHFEEPSHVSLTTGDGLGALEFERDAQVTIAQADLKDAFYHLAMPERLRDYFTLTPVKAGDMGIKTLHGQTLQQNQRITPRLAVVAMGWTWALHLCQSIHESLAESAGLAEEARIRDRQPPPHTACCHTQYVDNLIVIGSQSQAVLEAYHKATEKLKAAGLQVHEEECEKGGKVLGWEITSDALFQPSRSRAWKVRLAVRQLLARGRCTGSLMEKLVASVSKQCLSHYKRCWASVKQRLLTKHGKLKPPRTVDNILCQELDKLYHDGEDISSAQYLVAAVVFFNSSLRAPAMQKLPKVKQSLKGWRKMAPQRSRLPIPWEVCALLIQWAVDRRLVGIAIHMGLMFLLYLRPSEALRIRAGDLIPPLSKAKGGYQKWTVVLRPEEVGIASKTLEFDESLQLDLEYHQGLGEAVQRYCQNHHIAKKRCILSHDNAELVDHLQTAQEELNLTAIRAIHPYRFRHGGASHDFVSGQRDLPSIQQRGRWKSQASVRRYQK
ncbi:Reverse transcriptase domain-containing protein, partial [Durusdinium trenchii]